MSRKTTAVGVLPNPFAGTTFDEEFAAILKTLNHNQCDFIRLYLQPPHNATLCYKAAYNTNMADSVASACGSQLLRHPQIKAILERWKDRDTEMFMRVENVFLEEMEAKARVMVKTEKGNHFLEVDRPDHFTRDRGAHGVIKLRGLAAPEKVEDTKFAALLDFLEKRKTPDKSSAPKKRGK